MGRLLASLLLAAAVSFAADISGTWQFNVETSQGSGTPTVTFKQTGEQLTGTYASQIFGEMKLAGTVKGNAVEFAFVADAGGQTIKVSYKGTVEGAASMKGTAVYEGVDAQATWSATKK